MRPLILSTCEREFLLQSLKENNRLDGRSCTDHRKATITLGEEHGSCVVVQGNTKVFAQVSCTTITPKLGRPSEGTLYVNLEMPNMAASHFETGRLGDAGVEICRLLERCLKHSRCLDLESLCIITGELVWEIRVDVHVLDYDGSIIDCAIVAAVCALRHFRRPDVTVSSDKVSVHTLEEKEPVPLNLYHYPFCITFGFLNEGKILVVEPTEKEEYVIDGKIVVAMNSHREICALHCSGRSLFQKEQLLRYTSKAIPRARELTEVMNEAFEKDSKEREAKKKAGFVDLIGDRLITGTAQNEIREALPTTAAAAEKPTKLKGVSPQKSPTIIRKGKSARVANSTARLPTDDDDSDMEIVTEVTKTQVTTVKEEDIEIQENVVETKKKRRTRGKKSDQDVKSLLNEIEDDVQVLLPTESGYKTSTKPDPDDTNADIDLADALQSSKKGKHKRFQ